MSETLQKMDERNLRYMIDMIIYHPRYSPHDVVTTLAEAMDDQSFKAAQGGNYDRASDLAIHARFLDRIPYEIDNYDPTPS